MNCQIILTKLSFYIDNELSQEERLNVEAHLKTCDVCSIRFEQWQKNDEAVRQALKKHRPSADFAQKVMTALPQARQSFGRKALKYTSIAAAILVAVFLGVVVYMNSRTVDPYDITLYGQPILQSNGKASLRILARNPSTGKGINNVNAELSIHSKDGKSCYLGTFAADSYGIINCSFALPETPVGEYNLVALVGSHKIDSGITIKRDFKILLTTDKPIYQPNQVIHIRTLSLASFDLKPVVKKPALFEIEDPKGNKVYKKETQTSEFGIASCDFQLADEINMGFYRIAATIEGVKSEKVVEVKRYVLPKFRVDITTEHTFYQPGEKIKGAIKAEYFFGKPVSEGKVEITLATYLVDKWTEVQKLKETLDEDGATTFETTLPERFFGTELAKGDAALSLTAEVTDTAEHKEKKVHSVTVSQETLKLNAIPEGGELVSGVENIIYLITTYPDGSPAQTEITINKNKLQTDKGGVARYTVTDVKKPINYLAVDRMGNHISGKLKLNTSSNDFLLRTDKVSYKGGQTMQVVILSSGKSGTFYLDIIKSGQTVLTKTIELKDGRGEMLLDIPPDIFGTLQLSAYRIRPDGNVSRDSKIVFVDLPQNLVIRPTFDKTQYKPGEPITIGFEVLNENGQPVQSALGITAVDEAVYALQENHAGLEKVYFALEEDLLKPRYQIKGCPPPEILVTPPPQTDAPQVLASMAEKSTSLLTALGQSNYYDEKRKLQEDTKEFNNTAAEIPLKLLGFAVVIFTLIPVITGLMTFCIWLFKVLVGTLKKDWIRFIAWSIVGAQLLAVLCAPGVFYHYSHEYYGGYHYRANDGMITITVILSFIGLFIYGLVRIGKRHNLRWIVNTSLISIILFIIGSIATPSLLGAKRSAYESVGQGKAIASYYRQSKGLEASTTITALPSAEIDALSTSDIRSLVNGSTAAVTSSAGISPKKALQNTASFRIRQYFPETLLWRPELITDQMGRASIQIDKPADSITTWRMVSQAVAQDGRLGSNENGITVFQDFFVDLDLPVALTQDDEVSVPIAIYNYLKEPQTIALRFEKGDWFELLEASDTKEIELGVSDVKVIHFGIKVKGVGLHTLTIYAAGSKGLKDAIRKPIQVMPNGKEFEINISDRLNAKCSNKIHIPENAINDASMLLVRLYPGRFSEVVAGLENLVRLPYG